ncbi:GNAT family N-acetyltransferase [Phaeobacter sp. HS012]|uniref:GNAT family N-acetyltransferase n=1 Tax=unclassified Phaeobacter TaxID=2621772 RepID=UPI001B373683|nr:MULTISPECIES: GNAT family N-acetyltransferase [unclassified Phaeobacter]MBQ4807954.1 GNAT family N-acetyltransferase [Phaeobacter sp. HS012]MBQ4882803.1 GNAT family N-acetyltransferase [Phaeobacter sp. HS011]
MTTTPSLTDPKFYDVTDHTWPAAEMWQLGPVTLRRGDGGGSRVSAATVITGHASEAEITAAEQAMSEMGQDHLFMIRDGQDALDAQLAARGYVIKDPVVLWICPVEQLCHVEIPPVTAFCVWEPLAIQHEIWAAGGIGPERFAVMQRVEGTKTSLLGRCDDSPGGTGFVAIHDGTAMIHALEILSHQRRKGMGVWLMHRAARWAADQGARELAVLCTEANAGANGLYASLGMLRAGRYHYRHNPKGV